MWCADPVNAGYCNTNIAGDGTQCGNNKVKVTSRFNVTNTTFKKYITDVVYVKS